MHNWRSACLGHDIVTRSRVPNPSLRFALLIDRSLAVQGPRTNFYTRYMLSIAGLGGLLYGIDIGIISAALLYLNKTINLSVQQTSSLLQLFLAGACSRRQSQGSSPIG